MTEPEPELLDIRIYRVVKRASIFQSLFFYDRILNKLKYRNQIVGHDRIPTPKHTYGVVAKTNPFFFFWKVIKC
jgi:hypothetical protein